jgi:RimJ/RimL family protein N-acetyltransferase
VQQVLDPGNLASARSLERLGFRQQGLLRERWLVNGEAPDSALYGLLFPRLAGERAGPGARAA